MPGSITSKCMNSVRHTLILSLALPTPPHPTPPPTSCVDQKLQTLPWLRTSESQASASSELQPHWARALLQGPILSQVQEHIFHCGSPPLLDVGSSPTTFLAPLCTPLPLPHALFFTHKNKGRPGEPLPKICSNL